MTAGSAPKDAPIDASPDALARLTGRVGVGRSVRDEDLKCGVKPHQIPLDDK